MIAHGRTGLLAPFYDVDGFADVACRVLDDPTAFKPLGHAGAALIRERYSVDACLPQFLRLAREVGAPATEAS